MRTVFPSFPKRRGGPRISEIEVRSHFVAVALITAATICAAAAFSGGRVTVAKGATNVVTRVIPRLLALGLRDGVSKKSRPPHRGAVTSPAFSTGDI
jgi:hypothetical protein